MSQEYINLKKFLAGRFHQDWTDEGTCEEVISKYLRKADPWERVDIANQTVKLLENKTTEEQLEHFCGEECRSDIFPPGLGKTYRAWLTWLSETVRPRKAPTGTRPAVKVEAKPAPKPVVVVAPPVKAVAPAKAPVEKKAPAAKAPVKATPVKAAPAVKAPAKKPAAKPAAKKAAVKPAAKKKAPAAKTAKKR